jgi:hypothetical protein
MFRTRDLLELSDRLEALEAILAAEPV